jgi:UDP-N-acetylmuramate dehydrogenase
VLPSSLSRELRAVDGVRLWKDAPLAPLTTMGTGGKADLLVTVADVTATVATLRLLHAHDAPWVCLGAGSNVLVADAGYPGVVIKLDETFEYVEGVPVAPVPAARTVTLTVGAGTSLARLAAVAAEAGLAGLEFACGIPGSVGGGVAMNAGGYGRSLVDIAEEVEVATASGAGWLAAPDLEWGYRFCRLPAGSVVTAAKIRLVPDDPAQVLERQRAILRQRRARHPRAAHTFGSTFKNPPGEAAGRLLEAAGLKGVRLGSAEISSVHANFVVNLGGATTADVLALMDLMRQRVHRMSGVLLEPEVRLLGAGFPWQSSSALSQGPPDVDG